MNILVTGATGYVGGRLVPRLLEKGYNVSILVRDQSKVEGRWQNVKVLQGDVLNESSLKNIYNGIDIAYYLIHSLGSGEDEFAERDKKAAQTFSTLAAKNGVKRIIYLGGLGTTEESLSKHLQSRQQTGDKLREGGIPVTEFRAGVIVGSGSLSFEMIRYLTERLPFMITPKWVSTKTQPIAVRDVLRYLIDSIEMDETKGKIIEIGGKDVLTYKQLMQIYADVRGLKRYFIGVPVLTPKLSSYWVGLVTPLPSKVARPLVDGLKNELICHDNKAEELFDFSPIIYRKAVELALSRNKEGTTETIWADSYSSTSAKYEPPKKLTQEEGMFIEKRELLVNASGEETFNAVKSLGGTNGWYANLLWKVRGYIDLIFGGVGLRGGRRSYKELNLGDVLDFWRVEEIEENSLLRLRAEMKLPGNAWLQFKIEDAENNRSRLIQTAFFEPKGISGLLYWYSVYPLHGFIFSGMIKQLKQKAEVSN